MDQPPLDFTRWLIALRRAHATFGRRRFFQGRPIRGTVDIARSKPDGKPMTDQDWNERHARSLGVFLNGKAIPGHDDRHPPIADDSFLLLFNGQPRPVYWNLPSDLDHAWRLVLDTDRLQPEAGPSDSGRRVLTRARSIVVLQA